MIFPHLLLQGWPHISPPVSRVDWILMLLWVSNLEEVASCLCPDTERWLRQKCLPANSQMLLCNLKLDASNCICPLMLSWASIFNSFMEAEQLVRLGHCGIDSRVVHAVRERTKKFRNAELYANERQRTRWGVRWLYILPYENKL